MLKRIVTLLTTICLLLAGTACAEANPFVSDEQNTARISEDGQKATLGTDAYLFVDPYSASYVTFSVLDEQGKPIKNAAVYLTLNGYTEFFGMTDKDGHFSTYLFRNVEYGYMIRRIGYQQATGVMTAGNETKRVTVVLRKYYTLNVAVWRDGVPLNGVAVSVKGKTTRTGADGKAGFSLTQGVYCARIELPNGQIKSVLLNLEGDMTYTLDIGMADWPAEMPELPLNSGAGLSDLFIVFDKTYAPEDYELNERLIVPAATREPAFATVTQEKQQAVLTDDHANDINCFYVVAQPDKIENDMGESTALGAGGEPVYSQRSLVLSGWQLLNIREAGLDTILFENERMGLWASIEDLLNEKVMSLLRLMLDAQQNPEQYPWFSSKTFTPDSDSFAALPAAACWLDAESERLTAKRTVTKEMFGNALFEMRITPIAQNELSEIMAGKQAQEQAADEIILLSSALRERQIAMDLADGKLSAVERLALNGIKAEGKAYRVQVLMLAGEEKTDVTGLLGSLEIRLDISQEAALEAAVFASTAENGETLSGEAMIRSYLANSYPQRHAFLGVRLGEEAVEKAVVSGRFGGAGETGATSDALRADHQEQLAGEDVPVDSYGVDVRCTPYGLYDELAKRYYAIVTHETAADATLSRWQARMGIDGGGLYLIYEPLDKGT